MGKLGQVDEIADFVVFLLSDRSGVVTGSVIDCDQNVFGGRRAGRHWSWCPTPATTRATTTCAWSCTVADALETGWIAEA
jgi:hypothetical protein